MKIELTDDQIDNVVLFELRRHSELLKSNVASLKRKRSREKYENEDLERFREVLSAMKVMLGYYGSHLK
ncbi:MAG: hypothetical protein EBZ48_11680 [Proteobacteria bacterium]|nr:hypothetical protein [Pseudomonadota bacterium]